MESEGKRYALIIANSQYQDPLLRQLVAPSQDAQGLSEVLAEPRISGFDVKSLIDAPSYKVCEEIEAFFDDRDHDHLLLLYFSGHGVTDDDGLLYYATANTQPKRLRSTAISAGWVNEVMSRSLSRRQVLLLDCCHSGAFARTKGGSSVNVGGQLAGRTPEEGRGRFVLTASDAFQYSFEGDAVEGKGTYSVFTKALVEGLRTGGADLDGDGLITLDEMYRYVHQQVREQTPQQSPRKWESDAEGSLVIAFNPQPPKTELPDDLVHSIENFMPEAREKAIPRLDRLMRGRHRGLSVAARKALEVLAEDDSRRVSAAAKLCLGSPLENGAPSELPHSDRPLARPSEDRSVQTLLQPPHKAGREVEQPLTAGPTQQHHAEEQESSVVSIASYVKPIPEAPTLRANAKDPVFDKAPSASKFKKYLFTAGPVVLSLSWLLGILSGYTFGGWIHIFLVLATVVTYVRVFRWIVRTYAADRKTDPSKQQRWWREPYYLIACVLFLLWFFLFTGFHVTGVLVHLLLLASIVLVVAKLLSLSRATRAS